MTLLNLQIVTIEDNMKNLYPQKRNDVGKYETIFTDILESKIGLEKTNSEIIRSGIAQEEKDWLSCFKSKLIKENLLMANVFLPTKLNNVDRDEILKNGLDLSLDKKSNRIDLAVILKNILISEGYKEKDIENFLKETLENGQKTEISVSELIEKIAIFRKDKKKEDICLETADVMAIENILKKIGLDIDKINNVIEKAQIENREIGLKKLAEEIRKSDQTYGEQIEKKVLQNSNEDIEKILLKMDLKKGLERSSDAITLKQLAKMLDNRAATIDTRKSREYNEGKDIKILVDNIRSAAEEKKVNIKIEKLNILEENNIDAITKSKNNETLKIEIKPYNDNTQKENLSGKDTNIFNETKSKDVISTKIDQFLSIHKNTDKKKTGAKNELTDNFSNEIKEKNELKNYQSGSLTREIPKNLTNQIINQVGSKLGLAIKRGESELRVQLKPPELGAIELNMSMKNNVLKLAIISDHHNVKELISSHVHELRSSLVEQGIELQKVDVQIEYNLEQFMTNAQKDAQNRKSWKKNFNEITTEWKQDQITLGAIENELIPEVMIDMFA